MTFHYRLVAICIDKLSTIDNHGRLHNFKCTGINSNSKYITEVIHNINIVVYHLITSTGSTLSTTPTNCSTGTRIPWSTHLSNKIYSNIFTGNSNLQYKILVGLHGLIVKLDNSNTGQANRLTTLYGCGFGQYLVYSIYIYTLY